MAEGCRHEFVVFISIFGGINSPSMKKSVLLFLFTAYSLIAFAQAPAWVTKMGSANADFTFYSNVPDTSGNTYIAGAFTGTATFGSFSLTSSGGRDNFLAKLDCGGNVLWVEKIGGSGDEGEWISVTIDQLNNIYITGSHSNGCTFYSSNASNQTISSAGVQDLYLARYTPSGILSWVINAGGGSGDERSFSVKTDYQNNVLITGYYGYNGTSATLGGTSYSCSGVYDLFLEKFDGSGNFIWARTAGSSGDDIGVGLEVDSNNNVYVSAQYWNTLTINGTAFTLAHASTSGWDAGLLKYDASGNYKWGVGISGNSYDGSNMLVYNLGYLYVAGCYQGTCTFGSANASTQTYSSNGGWDIFGAKYDTSGNLIRVDHWGGTGDDIARSVVVSGNTVTWAGNYNNTVIVGPSSLVSAGASDIFLITTTLTGTFVSSKSYGGPLGEEAWCITKDRYSNFYVSGMFSGTSNFFGKSVTAYGSSDVYLAKFSSPNNILAFLPNDTSFCSPGSFTITPNITSTYYLWNTSATTPSITVSTSGTYKLKTVIACDTVYDSIIVNVVNPTVFTRTDTSICNGASITLGTTGAATRFLWNTGDTTASITVSPTVTTKYWVRGQIGTYACYTSDTVEITVNTCGTYCITCADTVITVNKGLQACYPFSGNAADASGNGNNGSVTNATLTTERSGNSNDAYLFNGSNTEITVPHAAALSYSKNSTFSISVWFNAASASNFSSVVSKSEQSDTSGYVIGFDNTGKFRFVSNLLYEVKTASAVTLNAWQHVVVTYNTNNQVRIYLNGVLSATGTVPNLNANSYDLKFGRLYAITSGWFFNGKIDDIRFYNRTLTATEVNQLYDATTLPVYAGADRTICTGDTTQLWATGGTTYSWTPAAGLSSTSIANPKAYPAITTDYICTITNGGCVTKDTVRVYVDACTTCPLGAASLNPEIIVNGDFESGNTGFSSDYTYVSSTVGNQGEYSITSDASLSSIYLSGCRDHTTGKGNFMLIDGNTSATKRFWYQNVPVKPYTSYVFTFWADNPYNAVPAQIRVTINGSVNSSFVLSNTTCEWKNFGVVWNSGSSTTALIELNDLNTAWIGNDFGVDDISFKECGCIPIVSNLSDQSICEGDSIQINASNVNALRYLWTPSTGVSNDTIANPYFKPLTTTTYIVRISNGSCITYDTLDIVVNKKQVVNLGNDTMLCTGSSFTLTSPAGVPRVWSTGDTSQSITILVQADSINYLPQVYWVRSGTGSCSSTDSINIYGIPHIKVDVLLNGKKVICPGGSVSLGVSNIPVWAGVKWSTGDTTRTISVSPATTTLYTVYYYNSLCNFSDTVTIIVLSKPSLVTSPDPTICEGANTTLTASGALSYLWSTGAVGSSLKVSPIVTTKYWVIGSSVSCPSDTSWITVFVTPKAKASFIATPPKGPIPLTVIFTNTSGGASSYHWYFGDGTDSIDASAGSIITHTYATHGKYTVKLVAYNPTGCNDSTEALIEAFAPYFIFIPSAFSPDGNTINEQFEISTNGIKYLEGTIYNRWGEEIYSWKTPGDAWWDGTFQNKKCQEDSYIYLLRVKDLSNNMHIYRGQVYLAR